MRVLLAPDKFKGTLTAQEAAAAMASGLADIAGITVDCCPVADGGEGFARALASREEAVLGIRDPLGRSIIAHCGWREDGTAVIEASDACGLGRVAETERDPWRSTTFGAGQLILHAVSRAASRILVGLGGSATNDAGAGVAAALGWQFLTSDGESLDPKPENFLAIERIKAPEELRLPAVIAACDVRNPLLGPNGASRVYARQKGADDRTIEYLEMALDHLAGLVAEQLGIDHRALPGAGAAGGLGYGLATFCQAELLPAFPLVAEALRLEERIAASDLVLTGEGRLDAQTLFGKAPAEVARLARKHGKRIAIVCGECDPAVDASPFDFVISLQSLGPPAGAKSGDATGLVARAAAAAVHWAMRY